MPTFTYEAKDKSGNAVSGIIEAVEPRGAASLLREQGLWPLRIEMLSPGAGGGAATLAPPAPPASPLSSPQPPPIDSAPAYQPAPPMGSQSKVDAAPFLVTVPLQDLATMYRQLATLLNAGVPMVQSLTSLAQQTRSGRLHSLLQEAIQTVSAGHPLSAVMVKHPSVFTGIQVEMIRAAETSGMMEQMCNRLADYLERELEIRRKLKKETLYPKIVLFVACLVSLLFGFLRSGAEGFFGQVKFGASVLLLGFGIWWLARYLNQFPAFGAAWDNVKMMIPGPGGVARKYATARFTRALGALYGGGILLTNAVPIAARACGNRAIGQTLLDHVGMLHEGQGLSGMLAASGLLSPIAVQMARTGEQTGSLDTMMDKVADYLESEADSKAHQLAVFAGVGALLFAALVVGYMVVSFYGGYFTNTFNQTTE